MDINIARGLVTASLLVLFIGIWAWSWSRKRAADFDAASRLPLDDDGHLPGNSEIKEQSS